MRILVTGSTGFIGHHTVLRLVQDDNQVFGIDNLNDYYDPRLKAARLQAQGFSFGKIDHLPSGVAGTTSLSHPKLNYSRIDICDKQTMNALFSEHRFDAVCHLAAQAGVRYSLTNPEAYIESNMSGFLTILECCRKYQVRNLVYASSSSVYGLNGRTPFRAEDGADHPVSLYAATKKSNELMAHTYSHLYGIATTGLRFFTVYGPWGRPDMALFKFTKSILEGQPIEVYNNGLMARDFTYIDDIVGGVVQALQNPARARTSWSSTEPDPSSSSCAYRVYNIGRSEPVGLMDFVRAIENSTGTKAKIKMMPMQPGDVEITWADTSPIQEELGYKPRVSVAEGVENFVRWYREYFQVGAGK